MTHADNLPGVRPIDSRRRHRPAIAMVATLMLSACAQIAEDRGFAAVETTAANVLKKDVRWIRTEEDAREVDRKVADLLRQPLTADSAVQIALLNNRGLQAAYNDLGLSAASLARAVTLPNPGFSYGRTSKGGVAEVERRLTLDVLGLLVMPLAAAIEERRFEEAKMRAADQMLRIAADTRKAFHAAVASRQVQTYMQQAKLAAEASAEMSSRLGETGAFGKMAQAREKVFYAETMAQVVRARASASLERERLIRLLGLWGRTLDFKLPDRLDALPQSVRDLPDVETRAVADRLDLKMARLEVEGLARSYGLTQATRFINVLEGSYLNTSEQGELSRLGYEIELSVPLFDFGTTKVAEAEHTYLMAVNRLAEMAVNVRSSVRESYESYRLSYDLARHYQTEVVPLRQIISEENMLHYNGMLVGVFELLADAREQIGSVIAAIQAQRDFLIAETELEAALIGGAGGASVLATDAAAPSSASAGH